MDEPPVMPVFLGIQANSGRFLNAVLRTDLSSYLRFISGAAVVLARYVKKILNVYKLEEFGMPECFWEFEVSDLSTIVTMDCHGASIHRQVEQASGERLKGLLDAN